MAVVEEVEEVFEQYVNVPSFGWEYCPEELGRREAETSVSSGYIY